MAARGPVADVLLRLRRSHPRHVPAKLARLTYRVVRARSRRWRLLRARGELSDGDLLRAFGNRFATTEALLRHMRTRDAPRFFVDGASARTRAAALAADYPRLADRVRAAAARACDHVVDLLGSGPVQLGWPIDWHTDFKTGYRWEPLLYEDIDYTAFAKSCDIKVPWELNRCYHWVTLGRAYALDRDPRLAAEFVRQLEQWLDANPWPYGVNWGRAMEAAVRSVNWLWAAAFFQDAPEFHDRACLRLLKSLVQHGRHIAANLEFSDNNGNHYLSNGVGLVHLGVLLPELREAAGWRRTGFRILWSELERQVYADGVDFEKAIGYQGLVLEFWYSCVVLADLNGISVPPSARRRLQRMCDFVLAYTRPDGTFPQVGDNDDGRLVALDDEPAGSHRRHLAVGGVLFGRTDLMDAAADSIETALWLLGPEALAVSRRPAALASQGFADGGFYVLRDGDSVMLVDAGEVGQRGIGGHGHNDLLSFDLWAAGAPAIVDSGTYCYTADPPARQDMRATAAHNTLRLDGQEMARMGDVPWLWRIENDAHPTVHAWRSNAEQDLLDAEHDGYRRLSGSPIHRRRIRFCKQAHVWVIEDWLDGTGEHVVESFLHPALPIAERSDISVRLTAPRADLWIVVAPESGLELQLVPGWISRAYGERQPATVLVYRTRVALPTRLTTAIVQVPSGAPLVTALDSLRAVGAAHDVAPETS